MSYCTKQDLIDRFSEQELVELTDRNRVGLVDDAVLDIRIGDADGIIDSFLGGRFTLPLAEVPRSLMRIACDITWFFLNKDHATDQVRQAYVDALQFLREAERGERHLGVSASGGEAKVSDSASMTSGGRTFDRSDKSFI